MATGADGHARGVPIAGSARSIWTLCTAPRPTAALRLYCFPYAGVGASAYRTWAQNLPDVEVQGIQLPGRETRLKEPCFTDLLVAAAAVARELMDALDRPFAFFGHSMGSLLAFEVVRELLRFGGPLPAHLVVSGRRAPHLPSKHEPFGRLPHEAFIDAIRCRFDGIPRPILDEPELLELLIPALRADMTMIEGYAYSQGAPLGCPITVYSGEEDSEALPGEMRTWRQHTASRFEERVFPGNHFFIQSARSAVLADLSARLGECR
jgi:medium-chain acyl-[acyl-carrier-protein] hydrolase